jgi:hypothetical protein
MKKILFLMMAMLFSMAIQAQGSKMKTTAKSFFAFHAGASFPMGDFGKTNLTNTDNSLSNQDAGFAKTGFNLNLNYGYQARQNIGIAASIFYNNNKLDNASIEKQMQIPGEIPITGIKMDHWQWYGLSAGPMFFHNFNPDMAIDFKLLGGVANVNTPKLTYQGIKLISEDWSIAPLFQTGVDFRIGFSNNMFIYTNVDYLYMKPSFKIETRLGTETIKETVKQKMSVINLTGGLGLRV